MRYQETERLIRRAGALEKGIVVTQRLIDQAEIPGGIESIQQDSKQAISDKYPHRILQTPISRISLMRESILDQARVLDEEISSVLRKAHQTLVKKRDELELIEAFLPDKGQEEHQPTKLGEFTPVDAGILAVLISHLQTTNELTVPAINVDKGVLDACNRLIEINPEVPEQERESLSYEYIGLRETVLTKTVSIISGKSFEEELSSFDPSLQIVLIWMWNQNADGRMSETIRRMLSKTPMQIRQTETAQVAAFEEFMRGTGRKQPEAEKQTEETLVPPLSDSEAKEPVVEEALLTTEGSSESQQPSAPITAVPLPYERPPAKPKIPNIEKRNPHVRKTVQEYIAALKAKNVTRSMNEAQITRTFPRLKKTFLVQIREKNYIKPQVGKDGVHPAYNQSEIIFSLYAYDHRENGGLNNALISELKEIIKEELAKSEPNSGNDGYI